MADTSGMQDIRGLDVDKLAKGFADEENILKRFVTVSTTANRAIKWFSKTAGFLSSSTHDTATEGIAAGSQYSNVSERSLPAVAEQSWTTTTSYVRKYFMESPLISIEDIKDTDIDILATNIRDLVRAVERMVDSRIYTVLSTGTGVQTSAATACWDAAATANPIKDILTMKQAIRVYGYDPEGAVLALNSYEHRCLIEWLISVKGSSIPSFSSKAVESGVVMELLGCKVVVSENFTTDQALLFVPQRACTWKTFMQISSIVIDEPFIGKKIRVLEEGEALLTDPKASYLLSNTKT